MRGGNRIFGLKHPAHSLSLLDGYTVITLAYRGGVSEGQDEFGGADIDDIKNLVYFIPELEKIIGFSLPSNKKYILGGSRGGMQMFLALQRYPELQNYFDKCVSLSGLLNIRTVIEKREGMKNMFISDFGLKNESDDTWITYRNPIEHCEKLNSKIPILIIQGTADIRTPIEEGRSMVKKLQDMKKNIYYWEIEGAAHCWKNNIAERDEKIQQWLNGSLSQLVQS